MKFLEPLCWEVTLGVIPDERELRAARNQALFRAVNEQIRGMNKGFAERTSTLAIACECADVTCIEQIQIRPEDYAAMRAHPRRFAVRPGHVYPHVESVVSENDGYSVVEKEEAVAAVVEATDPRAIEDESVG